MADQTRKPLFARATALLAGPLLLGRQALGLEWAMTRPGSPEPPQAPASRQTITPPEHAIKRRG